MALVRITGLHKSVAYCICNEWIAVHTAMACHQSTMSLADVFLTAKALVAALQSCAMKFQHAQSNISKCLQRTEAAALLTALQQLHNLVQSSLIKVAYRVDQKRKSLNAQVTDTVLCTVCCSWHGMPLPDPDQQKMRAAAATFETTLTKWRNSLPDVVQQIMSSESTSLQAFTAARLQLLHQEASANQAVAESIALHPDRCQTLQAVVSQLRKIESCVLFQAQLVKQAAAVSDDTIYSSSNFAYSSTPFSSWLKVHAEPTLAAAITSAMAPNTISSTSTVSSRRYMVWGSSTGWLALYAGLAYSSWQVLGVELLPLLVDVAQHVAQSAGLTNVSFECGDLLDSDLSSAGVLVLTEQCWDQGLIDKAAAKIKAELPDGSVVIDYTGSMGKAGLNSSYSTTVEVPVGWNEHQRMHAYIKGDR